MCEANHTLHTLHTVDRHDRCAWAQAQVKAEQAFSNYNSTTCDVTTVVQLLIEQAERAEGAYPRYPLRTEQKGIPAHERD